MAEATTRLGCRTRLLAGLGKDGFGVVLERDCQEKGVDLVPISAEGHSTAVLTPTLDGKGDLVVGVAAMDIAEHLSTSEVSCVIRRANTTWIADPSWVSHSCKPSLRRPPARWLSSMRTSRQRPSMLSFNMRSAQTNKVRPERISEEWRHCLCLELYD